MDKKRVNDGKNIRIAGLLGVGFDRQDRPIRITEAGPYRIVMGSEETHRMLQRVCREIDRRVESTGKRLADFSPEEFMELLRELYGPATA